jgi:hypothetical protein
MMRNGQNNKRMRGRNRKGGGGGHHHQNPLSRMYESNGPDLKIRGTASHVAEKYLQLARDAQSSGDLIAAENYYQHAEHYFRLIVAAQEQLRQTQPYFQQQSGEFRGNNPDDGRGNSPDDGYDDGENEQPLISGEPFAPREPQQFYPREQQQQPQHQQPQPHQQQPHQQQPHQPQPQQHFQPRQQNFPPQNFQRSSEEDVERLPSFITGGQQPQPQPPQHQQPPQQGQASNGYDGSPDRFPLHRRRRRHRSGPRDQSVPGDGDGPGPAGPRPNND